MTTLPQLKLFGAFRSGSNYTRALLELNYDVRVFSGNGGFKHAPVPAIFEAESFRPFPWPILAPVKDPYAWLASMWRYVNDVGARHTIHGETWASFLTEPLIVFQGNIAGFPKYRFANPVDYWNAINYNLVTLPEDARRIVRYEDMLADPEAECASIAAQFALARTSPTFQSVTRRVRNMDDRDRPRDVTAYVKDEPFDPEPFRQHAHDEQFTEPERGWVREQLDAALCDRLGYSG